MSKPVKFTRYSKGLNAQVLIPKAAAITAQASYSAFIQNAALGEFGVFDATTLLSYTAVALTAGKQFFFAQKRTGGTWKSPIYQFSNLVSLRNAYVAPVRCTGSLGYNGTTGSMNLTAAPSAGKQYEFGIIETTEGNDPFPFWNYNYTAKPGDTEVEVVEALAKALNDLTNPIYRANSSIVSAKVKAAGTYSAFTLTGTTPTATATNGSTVVTLGGTTPAFNGAVNDYITIDAAATPTSINAVGDVYKIVAISAGVSFTLNRPYQGATQTFTQAEVQGTRWQKIASVTATGLVFTDLNDNEHFRITARQEYLNADIVNLATYTRGNGTALQVQELEAEGLLMGGNTARNTQFGDAAFGNPDLFGQSTTETYDVFTFNNTKGAGLNDSMQSGTYTATLILAAPKSAGGVSASLNTIFGT